MKIGEYYINKRKAIIAAALFLGLIVSVYLVLNRQIFKSKAALDSCPFEVSQEASGQKQNIECDNETYTTSSLDILIKPKKPDSQPTAPVEAIIVFPATD